MLDNIVKPGALVIVRNRTPRLLFVVKTVGSTGVRLESLPDFACSTGNGGVEEERMLDEVVLLSDLEDSHATFKATTVYGLNEFAPFGSGSTLSFAFHMPGFPHIIKMGDPCRMREGFSLSTVHPDAPLMFGGLFKARNGARFALLLTPVDEDVMIVAVPCGTIELRQGVAAAEPAEHMQLMERVRCTRTFVGRF